MDAFWITVGVFCAASLSATAVGLVVYRVFLEDRIALHERMAREFAKESSVAGNRLFSGLHRLPGGSRSVRLVERCRRILEQAGVPFSLGAVAWASCGTAVGLAVLGYLATGRLAAVPVAAGLGFGLPTAAILSRRRQRRWQLCTQLPKAFETISRAVRAGQTVPAAMQLVADDLDPPISAEFAYCYYQQNLGIQPEVTLRTLAARCGVMELQLFVVAMLVQARTGGNLTELLDNLATTVRRRMQLQARVKALTGEGRMQALVLTVLPIVALGALVVLAPDYAQTLFDRPWLLASAGIAQLLGIVWIRSIVRVQY